MVLVGGGSRAQLLVPERNLPCQIFHKSVPKMTLRRTRGIVPLSKNNNEGERTRPVAYEMMCQNRTSYSIRMTYANNQRLRSARVHYVLVLARRTHARVYITYLHVRTPARAHSLPCKLVVQTCPARRDLRCISIGVRGGPARTANLL